MRCAAAASCPRFLIPSLAKARFRWLFTVGTEMNSRPAIWALVKCWPTRDTTCCSDGVRLSHPERARVWRAPASTGVGDSLFKAERPAFGHGALESVARQGPFAGPPARVLVHREPVPAARSR